MTDQTSNHEPEDVVHDADPGAVNVESVNDGESVPGEQPDQHPLHQPVLDDDDPLDLEDRPLEGVHLTLQATVVRCGRGRCGGVGTGRTGRIALRRARTGALRRSTR